MKRVIRLLLAASLLGVTLALFATTATAANPTTYIVISNRSTLPNNLVDRVEAAGGTVVNTIPEVGVIVATSSDPNFAATAAAIRGVRAATESIELNLIEPTDIVELNHNPPNTGDDDGLFDLQWGHDSVNATDAWLDGYTGKGVRVAILDSGIDAEHPDLAPNLNVGLSASFVPGEGFNVRPGVFFNHGSHVAGTVAAADNGIGTIGVAPDAELVAVKVLSEFTGSGSFEGVVEGIVYAAKIDSDIMNMSLGSGPIPRVPGQGIEDIWFLTGRATAFAHRQGTLVIASAGNDAFDFDDDDDEAINLPAMAPFVQAISATAPTGWAVDSNTFLRNITSYTNVGKRVVHFAGPGGDALYPGNENCTVAGIERPCWVFDLVMSTGSEAWYWAGGTSMAAPHASGVAAILAEKHNVNQNPNALINLMKAYAIDDGPGGFDKYYGYGSVSADR